MTNNFTPAKAGQQSKRLSKEEYAEKMKAEMRYDTFLPSPYVD